MSLPSSSKSKCLRALFLGLVLWSFCEEMDRAANGPGVSRKTSANITAFMNDVFTIISTWLKNNPLVFMHRLDGDILTLTENFSQKKISLNLKNIVRHKMTPHPQGLPTYLNLIFDNGLEVVLTHAGLAFAPQFENTGFIKDAPEAMCMSDYDQLLQSLRSLMSDEERRNEAILLFQLLISILDGARAIGFDIGREEEVLDELFSQFEQQLPGRNRDYT